jgi:hypothetical protein
MLFTIYFNDFSFFGKGIKDFENGKLGGFVENTSWGGLGGH